MFIRRLNLSLSVRRDEPFSHGILNRATFLLTAYLLADTFASFQGGGAVSGSNGTANGDSPGDIEVEDLGNDANI